MKLCTGTWPPQHLPSADRLTASPQSPEFFPASSLVYLAIPHGIGPINDKQRLKCRIPLPVCIIVHWRKSISGEFDCPSSRLDRRPHQFHEACNFWIMESMAQPRSASTPCRRSMRTWRSSALSRHCSTANNRGTMHIRRPPGGRRNAMPQISRLRYWIWIHTGLRYPWRTR